MSEATREAPLTAAEDAASNHRLFVIQNPAAGPRHPERLRRKIEAALQRRHISFEYAFTEEPGHGRELATRALAEGYRRFLIAGGDGTVLEAVSVLAGTEAALALLPVGTGNQLAANLGIPKGLTDSIEVAVKGEATKIDVGMIDDHPFTCLAGAGFDADVVSPNAESKRRFGYWAYVRAAASAAIRPRISELRVKVDGNLSVGRGIGVEIANMPGLTAPGLRRPIPLVPGGAADDGRLDVCMLAVESRIELLTALGAIVARRLERHRGLRYFNGTRIEVEADPPLQVQADGELLGTTPFVARVRPTALNVVTVKGRAERSDAG